MVNNNLNLKIKFDKEELDQFIVLCAALASSSEVISTELKYISNLLVKNKILLERPENDKADG